tara:strand:+ start:522 stop:806 length:285 start_codon:yes stop_codon:yes gene_type:complete
MESYKLQIILDPDLLNLKSRFKIGDLVVLSDDITVNMIIRDINKCRAGLVTKIRFFTKESFDYIADIKTICELEVLWTPSQQVTFEMENRLIRL